MDVYLDADEPLRVAVLYAPADRGRGEELVQQLATAGPTVRAWHPDLVPAGEPAEARGCEAVELAAVVLVLLSADFASAAACAKWLTHAIARQDPLGARVIPVRLRSVAESPAALRGMQMFPRDGKSIAARSDAE